MPTEKKNKTEYSTFIFVNTDNDIVDGIEKHGAVGGMVDDILGVQDGGETVAVYKLVSVFKVPETSRNIKVY